jgi:hypothetical protein
MAEAEWSWLTVLPPQSVRCPGVDVTVRIEGRNEDEVERLKHSRHSLGFAIAGDQLVSHIVDGSRADPLAGMDTARDNYGPALSRRLIVIGRMDADSESSNGTTFIAGSDVD